MIDEEKWRQVCERFGWREHPDGDAAFVELAIAFLELEKKVEQLKKPHEHFCPRCTVIG
jgi:hypothetical protein